MIEGVLRGVSLNNILTLSFSVSGIEEEPENGSSPQEEVELVTSPKDDSENNLKADLEAYSDDECDLAAFPPVQDSGKTHLLY